MAKTGKDRRNFLATLGSVGAAAILTGCGGSESEEPNRPRIENNEITPESTEGPSNYENNPEIEGENSDNNGETDEVWQMLSNESDRYEDYRQRKLEIGALNFHYEAENYTTYIEVEPAPRLEHSDDRNERNAVDGEESEIKFEGKPREEDSYVNVEYIPNERGSAIRFGEGNEEIPYMIDVGILETDFDSEKKASPTQ